VWKVHSCAQPKKDKQTRKAKRFQKNLAKRIFHRLKRKWGGHFPKFSKKVEQNCEETVLNLLQDVKKVISVE
jgi:hypothetical protein